MQKSQQYLRKNAYTLRPGNRRPVNQIIQLIFAIWILNLSSLTDRNLYIQVQ